MNDGSISSSLPSAVSVSGAFAGPTEDDLRADFVTGRDGGGPGLGHHDGGGGDGSGHIPMMQPDVRERGGGSGGAAIRGAISGANQGSGGVHSGGGPGSSNDVVRKHQRDIREKK
jgi:hypothetical protein